MALAVVLLVGAGPDAAHAVVAAAHRSRLRSDQRADDADFAAGGGYETPGAGRGFYQRLIDRVRQLPGVARPAPRARCRSDRRSATSACTVDGYVPPPGTDAKGDWQIVTDGYIEAMGERVVRGRGITAATDTETHARRAHQRGDGAALLGRTRPDRRPLPDRQRDPSARGSPSSASWQTSATTASPTSSKRSSTFRTRSGTSRRAIRSAR